MSATPGNIIAGLGTLYTAAIGEALPEISNLAPPLITITPGGTWADFGATADEQEWSYEAEFEGEEINEKNMDVATYLIKESMTFKISLKERTLALWNKLMAASTLSTTAAAADQTAQTKLAIGEGSAVGRALLYMHTNPNSGSRLFHMPRVMPVKFGPVTFKKGATKPFGAEFKVDYDASAGYAMKIFDITAAASS